MSLPPNAIQPIRGRRPVLQNCGLAELSIDPAYQRGIDQAPSRALIRRIAEAWDWRLCQPLVVAQRAEGLFVVDGQHRLAAARLRGDLYDLPCVIVASEGPQEEAGLFRALNARRRPLSALDLFRAGLAEGEGDSVMIARMLADAGLALARHTNFTAWKPGQVANVSGIRRALADHGPDATAAALKAVAQAFEGEVLRYFGTIFPGTAQLFAREAEAIAETGADLVTMVLQGQSQAEWAREIGSTAAARGIHARTASALVIRAAWAEAAGEDEEERAAA